MCLVFQITPSVHKQAGVILIIITSWDYSLYYAPEWGIYMSDNNNYFTPDNDNDNDYDFIDFEQDYQYYDDENDNSISYDDDEFIDDKPTVPDEHKAASSKASNSFAGFIFSEILSLAKIFIFAVVFALLFTNFVVINAQVPSGSMRDTIWEGDRLFGFRLAYKFSEPERGDVIIFKFPDDESQNYVKRVIGLPNDVVQIKDGRVYVNGDELDEPYIRDYIFNDGETYTYIVPEDSYFMLGDNRNNSKDSRFWVNTYVKKEKIIAKVIFRYYSGEKSKIDFSLIK